MEPEIRFCTRADGVRLAYATLGEGPPLLRPPGWISHIEQDWKNTRVRSFYEALARHHKLIFYDKHGTGLSDRERSDISFETELLDLETIIDHLGLERMALFGISEAGPVAAAYAATNPGHVSHLILFGAYARGSGITTSELQESLLSLIKAHWGVGSEALADLFMPGADSEDKTNFARLQRASASAEMAGLLLRLVYEIDVVDTVPNVDVPTLVIHRERDRAIPFRLGRELAALIPSARLVPLEGRIHFPWLGDSDAVLEAVAEFLGDPTGEPREEAAQKDGDAPSEPSAQSPEEADAETRQVQALISSLETVTLPRFRVVGDYIRYDEAVRNTLADARQKISAGLRTPGRKRENHLIWAAPGSGKTYFVEQVAAALGETIRYCELNLAKCDQHEFLSGLAELERVEKPALYLIDEVDAKPDEPWPYESLLPYLDASAERGAMVVFVLAGSGGASTDELKERIAARPKGKDLLSRIPNTNEYEIAPLGSGDRILVAVGHLMQAGRNRGHEIRAVERLGLYYIALSTRLANARQLREFAVRAVDRIPQNAERIKYDDLFDAGDPENKEFWLRAGEASAALGNTFVMLEE